ncbi:glycosyltransferase family 2 protein [Gloeocapsopsis crepidinum LEGE 06123]|uniref:Glycosyltransferase family 2 protein n=1 Tax=Gloeocapsopsis crepidinum LEGE 06123 TaxID=588587 RepID=A0ABR9UKJ3_9CHRO|nr:glycosyltransferase family A protein [Gloeocapsopsis crepidinum]MBE9188811.1 glycosyltransferase family 2 protein [Gloeocapsopsis crepidinum LEGE 06123]
MSSKPLVSGIIIFLNAEKFIQEAIESVFAQTYNRWELLLVDDGSTDASTAIAQRYATQYPEKVRYLEHDGHQNRGMSASRNLGISNAKGEYIAFLDADDIWLPPKLERQVAILNSQPEAAMVYGSTQMWYSWTGKPKDVRRDRGRKLGVQPDTLVQPPQLLALFLQGEDAETPATCGVLIRRKTIEDIGGFVETFRGMHEDQAFFAKLCLKVPVFVESGCWDRYRQHPDSSCYVAVKTGEFHFSQMNSAQLTFLNWLEKYLSEQGVKDTKVWESLQQALWPYRQPILYRLYQMKIFYLLYWVKTLLKLIAPAPVHLWLKANTKRANSKVVNIVRQSSW